MEHETHPAIIMGLGNPDTALAGTYHNIGLRAVQTLAEHAALTAAGGVPPPPKPYKGLFSSTTIGERTFVFPLVYMNDSGRAAKEALRVLHTTPAGLIVVHDDSDLAIGSFKFVRGGRAAGHNGVQSVIDHLGTEDFFRVRIGIRPADEHRRRKAGDFVLSPVTAKDEKVLHEVFARLPAALGLP